MKKFLFLFLCCFCLLAILPKKTFAFDLQSEVEILALKHNYTQEATCVSFGSYCVLGVRTQGILLASEEDKYISTLKEEIKNLDGNLQTIYITKDLQEVLIIKDARQKLDGGMGLFDLYNYIQKKYPNAIDKVISKL